MPEENQLSLGAVPAHLQSAKLDPTRMDDFGEVSFPSISLVGNNKFKLRFGGEDVMMNSPLPVIVLGVSPRGRARSRAYYSKTYVPGSAEAPDCASSDGVRPDSGVAMQNVNSCSECPYSVWGSEPLRGVGQACAEHKSLFVILASEPAQTAMVFQLRVSPTSLKSLATYGQALKNHNLDISMVVTNLMYEPDVSHQQLRLELGSNPATNNSPFLAEDAFAVVTQRISAPEITNILAAPPSAMREALPALVGQAPDNKPAGPPAASPTPPAAAPTPPAAAPTPPAAAPTPPAEVRSEDGFTYDQMVAAGWSDANMLASPIYNCLVKSVVEAPPVAPPKQEAPPVAPPKQEAPPVAPPKQEAPPSAPPKQEAPASAQDAPVLKDSKGVAWSEVYHTSNQGKKVDGSWKRKPGLTDELKAEAESYEASFSASTTSTTAPPELKETEPAGPPVSKPPEEVKSEDGFTYAQMVAAGWDDAAMLASPVYNCLVPKQEAAPEVPSPGAEAGTGSALGDSLAEWG